MISNNINYKALLKQWSTKKLSSNECNKLLNMLDKNFGEPIITSDTSIQQDKIPEFNSIINSHLMFLDKKID